MAGSDLTQPFYCIRCKAQIAPDAAFCPRCGQNQSERVLNAAEEPPRLRAEPIITRPGPQAQNQPNAAPPPSVVVVHPGAYQSGGSSAGATAAGAAVGTLGGLALGGIGCVAASILVPLFVVFLLFMGCVAMFSGSNNSAAKPPAQTAPVGR